MVERVARAICRKEYGREVWPDASLDLKDEYRSMARAAIAAMREPTETMLKADEVHPSCHMCGGHLEGWHHMIDEALR